MHAPQKTSILYANPIDPSNRLLPFCQAILNAFKEVSKENGESLIVEENRDLLFSISAEEKIKQMDQGGDENGGLEKGELEGGSLVLPPEKEKGGGRKKGKGKKV